MSVRDDVHILIFIVNYPSHRSFDQPKPSFIRQLNKIASSSSICYTCIALFIIYLKKLLIWSYSRHNSFHWISQQVTYLNSIVTRLQLEIYWVLFTHSSVSCLVSRNHFHNQKIQKKIEFWYTVIQRLRLVNKSWTCYL